MNAAVLILMTLLAGGALCVPAESPIIQNSAGSNQKATMNKDVLSWVQEAPFSDPAKMRLHPNFSYDDWFVRGRALPHIMETLIDLLEREDLEHPSGDGMRIAYALGWLGDKRTRGVKALLRALDSKDITLRIEAASALGRQGDASVLPTLEKLLSDENEDINVRANACIALGRIGSPSSEPLLRQTLHARDPFLVSCAQEALRLLGATRAGQSP